MTRAIASVESIAKASKDWTSARFLSECAHSWHDRVTLQMQKCGSSILTHANCAWGTGSLCDGRSPASDPVAPGRGVSDQAARAVSSFAAIILAAGARRPGIDRLGRFN